MEETQEYKLIDDFMGWIVKDDGKGMYKVDDKGFKNAFKSTGYSNYKVNWSELMPVVEKIESIGYWFEIKGGGYQIADVGLINSENEGVLFSTGGTKIQATYQTVIKFIQYYKDLNFNP